MHLTILILKSVLVTIYIFKKKKNAIQPIQPIITGQEDITQLKGTIMTAITELLYSSQENHMYSVLYNQRMSCHTATSNPETSQKLVRNVYCQLINSR